MLCIKIDQNQKKKVVISVCLCTYFFVIVDETTPLLTLPQKNWTNVRQCLTLGGLDRVPVNGERVQKYSIESSIEYSNYSRVSSRVYLLAQIWYQCLTLFNLNLPYKLKHKIST